MKPHDPKGRRIEIPDDELQAIYGGVPRPRPPTPEVELAVGLGLRIARWLRRSS